MIIGREHEQSILLSLKDREESQFCAVYGRRRVGKTYLIRETFRYQFTFQHTGIAKGNMRQQLRAFRDSLVRAGMERCPIPGNWYEAFGRLEQLLEGAPAGKKVVFIDELPWIDTPKSDMVGALEHFWNGWVTARAEKDIVLIVCGSATSWIVRNLLRSKGGLRGRLTERIQLMPFTLRECEQYCTVQNMQFSRRDIAELYMILGGIPYYWSFLERGRSVAQEVDRLFFRQGAQLKDEFEALYDTLFSRPERYIDVIRALSLKKAGLTREELLGLTHLKNGGSFTRVLEELEQCHFIRHYPSYEKSERDRLYQLIDNYTLFHYHCISRNAYADEEYWLHTCRNPEHNTWAGLGFERLGLQHIPQIKDALGISGVVCNVCSWRTVRNDSHEGAQIDLMIVRGDNVIDLCEMKFSRGPYAITGQDVREWDRKIAIARQVIGSRYTYHLVLVTTEGVEENQYRSAPQAVITLDDLFR